jgi:CBS domain-containing protein
MTMLVQDMMTAYPRTCLENDSITAAAQIMVAEDCGVVPVIDHPDSMRLAGVVTDRDIVVRLVAANRNPLEARVQDAMTRDVKTLPTTASMREAADLMSAEQIRRIMIVDQNGRLQGVLSQGDLAKEGTQPRMVAETLDHISRTSAEANA